MTKYIHSDYTFRDWGNDHLMSSLTQRTHCESAQVGASIYYLAPICPILIEGASWCFRSSVINVHSDSMANNTGNVRVLPFPCCMILWVNGYRSLWGKSKSSLYTIAVVMLGHFSSGPIFFSQWIPSIETGQVIMMFYWDGCLCLLITHPWLFWCIDQTIPSLAAHLPCS